MIPGANPGGASAGTPDESSDASPDAGTPERSETAPSPAERSESPGAPGTTAPLAGAREIPATAEAFVPAAASKTFFVALSGASISPKSASVSVVLKVGTKNVSNFTNFSGKGGVKCTKGCTVPGPQTNPGKYPMTVTIYDKAGGKGNQLATYSAKSVTVKSTKTTVKVTALKIVKTAVVGSASGAAGTPQGPTALGLTLKDADGSAVTGTLSNPVTVTDADTTTATTLSGGTGSAHVQTFTTASQVLKIAYSGLAISTVSITPSGHGISGTAGSFSASQSTVAANIVPASTIATDEIDLYATSGTGSSAVATLTQPGWQGGSFSNFFTYALSGANCSSYTVSPASGTAAAYTVTSTVSAIAGACTMTVTGGGGSTLPIKLTYSTTGIGINAKPH